MTIENAEFIDQSKQEILDSLVRYAESSFDEDLSPDDVAAIRSFYEPVAEYLALQQDSLAEVLDASQIENAEGEALGLLTASIGVRRLQAQRATTRLRFSRSGPTDTTYSVASGELAQTDAASPVRFETTEGTGIQFLDGFEDNDIAEYSGDTANYSVQTATVYDGSYALEAAANTSVDVIYNGNDTLETGSKTHHRLNLGAGGKGGVVFGLQDADSYYRASVDASAGQAIIEKNDNGTVSTVASTSASIPTGEWLHLIVDWKDNDEIVLTVRDAADSEVASTSGSDNQFISGYVGWYSASDSTAKQYDNLTMSAASAEAQAVEAGAAGNVGGNTLVVMPDPPTGVQSVTNPAGATGGSDREDDDDLRSRAQKELSEGIRGTQVALINQLSKITETRNVTVIVNDEDTADAQNRPAHSFEAVVEQPADADVREHAAEIIVQTKAAGDTSVGGYAGTSVSKTIELSNGQTKTIDYSEPTQVDIYMDCDLTYDNDYPGDAEVQDSVVRYIGGVLNSGSNERGNLGAGDDVIYNGVLEAIMDISGVHDVTNLEIATSSSPTGTSNIAIASTEVATSDATDASLDVTSSQI